MKISELNLLIDNPRIELLLEPHADEIRIRFANYYPIHGLVCSNKIISRYKLIQLGEIDAIKMGVIIVMDNIFEYLYQTHGNGD